MRARHIKRSNLVFSPGQVALVHDLSEAPSVTSISGTSQLNITPSSIPSTSITLATLSSSTISSSSSYSTSPSPTPALSYSTSSTSTSHASLSISISSSVLTITAPTATAGTALNLISVIVDNSSQTSSPSPSSPSVPKTNNALRHSPSFYTGIILGIMIIIACMAALVAWYFRVRTRKSRRLKDLAVRVPWARSNSNSSNAFSHGEHDAEKGDAVSLRREQSEKLRLHLDLMGDRDVGEPKRTQSFIEKASSPVKRRALPILSVPSPPPVVYPGSDLRDSLAYPLPRPLLSAPAPAPSPYHPHSNNPYAPHNYQQPEPGYRTRHQAAFQPQFPAEFGTPRESIVQPRFLALNTHKERRRMSDAIEEDEPVEGWTDSARKVLGFPPHDQTEEDRYTHIPKRRKGMAGWGQLVDEELHVHQGLGIAENPFEPRSSVVGLGLTPISGSSFLPSLEHLHIPTVAHSGSHGQSPSEYATSVSAYNLYSAAPSTNSSYRSAAPLIIKKKNPSLSVSRASSVASKYSVGSVMTEKEEAAGRALRERWARRV
ncbi:hypothetical protein WG66_003871 [Moniliophthora roreri]|nr:hypothetical protein WG66_003871 [Moniliophthora roreri]